MNGQIYYGDVSPQKARKILHDGEVRGHPLTDKQRRFFGAKSDYAGAACGMDYGPGEDTSDLERLRDTLDMLCAQMHTMLKTEQPTEYTHGYAGPSFLKDIDEWNVERAHGMVNDGQIPDPNFYGAFYEETPPENESTQPAESESQARWGHVPRRIRPTRPAPRFKDNIRKARKRQEFGEHAHPDDRLYHDYAAYGPLNPNDQDIHDRIGWDRSDQPPMAGIVPGPTPPPLPPGYGSRRSQAPQIPQFTPRISTARGDELNRRKQMLGVDQIPWSGQNDATVGGSEGYAPGGYDEDYAAYMDMGGMDEYAGFQDEGNFGHYPGPAHDEQRESEGWGNEGWDSDQSQSPQSENALSWQPHPTQPGKWIVAADSSGTSFNPIGVNPYAPVGYPPAQNYPLAPGKGFGYSAYADPAGNPHLSTNTRWSNFRENRGGQTSTGRKSFRVGPTGAGIGPGPEGDVDWDSSPYPNDSWSPDRVYDRPGEPDVDFNSPLYARYAVFPHSHNLPEEDLNDRRRPPITYPPVRTTGRPSPPGVRPGNPWQTQGPTPRRGTGRRPVFRPHLGRFSAYAEPGTLPDYPEEGFYPKAPYETPGQIGEQMREQSRYQNAQDSFYGPTGYNSGEPSYPDDSGAMTGTEHDIPNNDWWVSRGMH